MTPGHGKAALAAYFLGHEARLWKGVRIALIGAFMHVIMGLAVFLVFKLIIGQMPTMFGRSAPSFGALGCVFIVVAGMIMLVQSIRPMQSHSHGDHAITAGIGILPCPLTISVLGFAWSQGSAVMIALMVASLAFGIGMTTSFDGAWPGDAKFAPVFEELNRRKAVVYFHPLAPDCCSYLMDYVPASVVEVPQDTTRAVVSLLFSGALNRYKNIRFIFSHAGAGVPVLAGRMANAVTRSAKIAELVGPDGVDGALRKLYYDTANASYAPTFAALLTLVPLSQVLFGTDYPYLTVEQNLQDIAACPLDAAQCLAIDRDNALALFPHLVER